jgi:hypothetical protein
MTLADGSKGKRVLAMRNASDVPVYNVTVDYSGGGTVLGGSNYAVLPPSDEPVLEDIPPHVVAEAEKLPHPHVPTSERPLDVQITYRDASGRAWTRTTKGVLFDPSTG